MHLQESILFDLWPWPSGSRPPKCCSVSSTSCGLFTCQVWGCFVQRLRSRCIYKKIHFYLWLWPLLSSSHSMWLRIFYIIWPIHLQGLRFLLPTVQEEIHLQENALFDLWPWRSPVPFTSCDLSRYKVWSCYNIYWLRRRCIYKKIHYLIFDLDLGVKVTQNVSQHPLHHVAYQGTKCKVAMSNGLGDAFTRKVTNGRTDRQTDRRTDRQTDRQTDDEPTLVRN